MKRRVVLSALSVGVLALPQVARSAQVPIIGVTLPQTGVQAEVARDLLLGYQLAVASTGNRVELRVLDDASKPELVAENMRRLASDPSVLIASGVVGTPHAEAAIPVTRKAGLPLVGLRSGAQFLRNGQDGVYHLRSSFEEELDKVVAHCQGAGIQQMAILFSNDSFGKSSRDHLVARLNQANITVITSTSVERGGENIKAAVSSAASVIKASTSPLGIALLLIAKPMLAAAREIRLEQRIISPLFAMSFVATREVATKPEPSLAGLGLVSAFPLPRASAAALAVHFRRDASRHANALDVVESLTAFEGYFYGTVAARAAMGQTSREGIVRQLRAGVQIDPALSIQFDSNRVGFRYLEVVRKTADDGKLRA